MTKENKLVVSSQATFNELKFPRAKNEKDITTRDKSSLKNPESGVDKELPNLDQLFDGFREILDPEHVDRICSDYYKNEPSSSKQRESSKVTQEEPVPQMSEKAKGKQRQVEIEEVIDEEYIDPDVEFGPDTEFEKETLEEASWCEFKEWVDEQRNREANKSPSVVSFETSSTFEIPESRVPSPVEDPQPSKPSRSLKYKKDETRLRRQKMSKSERRHTFFKEMNERESSEEDARAPPSPDQLNKDLPDEPKNSSFRQRSYP